MRISEYCVDYLTSVETLEECRTKVLNDRTVENEYVQLSLELEKEILHLLRKKETIITIE